ncbi:unnamed protein product [Orchesella dallaii]|uniref:Odorant receptor n=1 Tax=Orchesella dallaii TaxID=48710 RepID=A0ABP1QUQ1_9HEXA
MPDTLVILALNLNQKIVDLLFPVHPFSWNEHSLTWKYEQNWKNNRSYYLGDLIGIVFFFATVFVYFAVVTKSLQIDIYTIITISLLCATSSFSLLLDLFCWINGSNLVNLTNWIFSLELNVNETRKHIRKKKNTWVWFKDFSRELCKIFREETFSRMGLFLNYITISYSGTVILVPVALMLTPWQSSPIFLIVKLLFPAMEELTDNNFPIKLAINTGKYTVLLFQTQIIMLNFKAVVLLGFGLAASYLNQLRLLEEYVCGHNAIRKYSELLVAYNVVQVMISKMLGTFFTIGFIGLVCGTNLAVLSFKQGSTNLLILGVVGTIILFVAFQTTFFVGRSVFELSRGIINNWKIEVANKRDGGVLKRMVYCQSPILLSFGFIANATKESQINFMQDVFVNTCNILLLLPL